jgi:single-stranded DNA-specific DHH superfamily exonuclease
VGPRLNAAGRLADMSLGIECLTTDDEGRAWAIAQQLDAINRERRDIEAGMQDTALLLLDDFDPADRRTIACSTLLAPGRDRHRGLAPEGQVLPPDHHLRARR